MLSNSNIAYNVSVAEPFFSTPANHVNIILRVQVCDIHTICVNSYVPEIKVSIQVIIITESEGIFKMAAKMAEKNESLSSKYLGRCVKITRFVICVNLYVVIKEFMKKSRWRPTLQKKTEHTHYLSIRMCYCY